MDDTPQWRLESIWPAPITSPRFEAVRLSAIAEQEALAARLDALDTIAADPEGWADVLMDHAESYVLLNQLFAVTLLACSVATDDPELSAARARVGQLLHVAGKVSLTKEAGLQAASDEAFEALLAQPRLQTVVASLRHRRAGERLRPPPAQHRVAAELSREAIEGWCTLQGKLVGPLAVTVGDRTMGMAQVSTLLRDPDREVRRAAYHARNEACASVESLVADALSHIVGARNTIAELAGVRVLDLSLHQCKTSPAALDAMWQGVASVQPALRRYLAHKARRMGVDRLASYDLGAPMAGATPAWTFAEGIALIRETSEAFHPGLHRVVSRAADEGWIHARPLPNKRVGAFCMAVAGTDQSRVLMTWTDRASDVLTLAHELGHAWHHQVLGHELPTNRAVPTNLAETASILVETLVQDAMLRTAAPADADAMLDGTLEAAASTFLGMPALFDFEKRLYEERASGMFTPEGLRGTAAEAFADHYGDILIEPPSTMWCWIPQLYGSGRSFYNWQYPFANLFALAFLAHVRTLETTDVIEEVLGRSGRESPMQIAADVLGVDLEDPAFWRGASASIEPLVDRYAAA